MASQAPGDRKTEERSGAERDAAGRPWLVWSWISVSPPHPEDPVCYTLPGSHIALDCHAPQVLLPLGYRVPAIPLTLTLSDSRYPKFLHPKYHQYTCTSRFFSPPGSHTTDLPMPLPLKCLIIPSLVFWPH